MLQVNEAPTLSEGPLTGPPEVRPLPTPPKQQKRWPWILGGVMVIVIGAAAALWWLLDSTVPASDYDEVVAELAASDEALEAARADAAVLQEDLDARRAENDDLSAALAVETEQVAELDALAESLQNQMDAAATSAKHNAYLALDWIPEDVAAMQEVGVDTTTANALLQELGETETWNEWVETENVWLTRDKTLAEIDDDALTDAWVRWWDAEIDSVEEAAALADFNNRLAYLILKPLNGG